MLQPTPAHLTDDLTTAEILAALYADKDAPADAPYDTTELPYGWWVESQGYHIAHTIWFLDQFNYERLASFEEEYGVTRRYFEQKYSAALTARRYARLAEMAAEGN